MGSVHSQAGKPERVQLTLELAKLTNSQHRKQSLRSRQVGEQPACLGRMTSSLNMLMLR